MRLLKGLGRPRGRVPLCIRSTSRFLSFSADGPGIQHAGLWSSGEATGLYVYYIHDYNTKGTEISVECIQFLQSIVVASYCSWNSGTYMPPLFLIFVHSTFFAGRFRQNLFEWLHSLVFCLEVKLNWIHSLTAALTP